MANRESGERGVTEPRYHRAVTRVDRSLLAVVMAGLCVGASPRQAPSSMTFFVTSTPRGFGANLGGLAGADAICLRLATAVGGPAVHARDRIGRGPWVNAAGEQIASSVANLHSDANNLTQETALTEKG